MPGACSSIFTSGVELLELPHDMLVVWALVLVSTSSRMSSPSIRNSQDDLHLWSESHLSHNYSIGLDAFVPLFRPEINVGQV